MDFEVVDVLDGSLVVVDASQLRRVVDRRGNVLDELLPPDAAELSAATHNELFPGERAFVVEYTAKAFAEAG